MKNCFCLLTLIGSSVLAAAPNDAVRVLAQAPLRFEPARAGQSAEFVARGARFHFAFHGNQADLLAGDHRVSLRFQGANAHARLQGADKLRSTTNDYLGSDRSQWRTGVANFGQLRAADLYPGIDLVYYGTAGELEYDLAVKPGADPKRIHLRSNGAQAAMDADGNLIAELIQKRPVAYQIAADGSRVAVETRYRKNADGSYGFTLGDYDRARELIIDPVITLGVYFSGSYQEIASAIGHDKIGFLYVAGSTESTDLTLAGASYQATAGGLRDIFFAKVDPNAAPGTQVVYTTYFGGTGDETLGGMTVGPNGDVYLAGSTTSTNLPLANAEQGTFGGVIDGFVAWFDPSQTLTYSSYIGGTLGDAALAVAVDAAGKMYVTGGTVSDDFPVTAGYRGTRAGSQDAFAVVIDPSLSGTASLVYSTYLGGANSDLGRGIAVAKDGTFWVVGGTYSSDFPAFGASFQPGYHSGGDGFAAHFDPTQGTNSLLYTTYLGGTDQDEARSVAIDATGRVIISGWTLSTDFPTTPDAMQRLYGGNTDVFVTILNPANVAGGTAQLVYSTYFGGPDGDDAFDMKVDAAGNIYLAGVTLSAGLPVTPNAVQSFYDFSMDAFALKFNPTQPGPLAIKYLTYLGSDGVQVGYGVDVDAKGTIYMVGVTSGPIFDAFGGAAKTSAPGNQDAFLVGLSTAQ